MATSRTGTTHGHRTPSNGNSNQSGGRRRRAPRKRINPFWNAVRILFNTGLLLIVLAGFAGLGVFVAAIHSLPSSISQIENYKPLGRTLIYSSDGTLLANIFQQNRQIVTIDKIPTTLQNATVAIEDNRFWKNNMGFDIRGIGRAIWQDIRGGDAYSQGGSTIPQQLVRNLGIGGLTKEKTFTRKIREIIYANQIERNYSKQQILEMYLNEVYYGSGAYGVQAASEVYFGKSLEKLDLAQCAMIAGLPQSPTHYSPYGHKDRAMVRRNQVLDAMLKYGDITQVQHDEAVAEPIVLAFPKPPAASSKVYHAPYFVGYVIKYLTQRYGSDFIYAGGIRVYTTLNWQMQQAAELAVQQHLADMAYTGADDAALVAMEPQTGYIKAMVGGVDYAKSQFNIAADGRRQPGSSFKVVIYTGAIDSGIITENTRILDGPITLPGANGTLWRPKNDNDRWNGWVTAKWAVADSINVPAVKVLERLGVENAIHYAQIMGVKSPLAPYLTLALGASAVTPLEMADVYATVDNKGARPIPTPITQITDNTGQVIESDVPRLETTSISQNACVQMTDMLRAVVTEGTASASFRDNNPPDACGKTGTTQSHLDVWFDGFTKDMVCTVWAGHPSTNPKTHKPIYGIPMAHEAYGATICAPIWKQFMIAAEAIEQQERDREAKLAKPQSEQVTPAGQAPQPNAAPPASKNASATSLPLPKPGISTATTPSTAALTTAGGGTSPVWVDDKTGRPTTPNAPDSHQETFANGYAPKPTPVAAPTPHQNTTEPPPPAPASGGSATTASVPTAQKAPASPRMVTVTICAQSGMLATRWCPETITETFPAGTQPRRYCTIHKPPPGEQ